MARIDEAGEEVLSRLGDVVLRKVLERFHDGTGRWMKNINKYPDSQNLHPDTEIETKDSWIVSCRHELCVYYLFNCLGRQGLLLLSLRSNSPLLSRRFSNCLH